MDPVTEGRHAGEYGRFLVFDAALWSEADDAVNLPGGVVSSGRADEGTPGVALQENTKDLLHG